MARIKKPLPTETLRFRQYLGTQYLSRENMRQEPDSQYGLPIISIYILGHTLGELKEPVIYVHRRYLDYEDNVIEGKDKFIESLTHDVSSCRSPSYNGEPAIVWNDCFTSSTRTAI